MIATLISMFDHMTGVVAVPDEQGISIADFRIDKISNESRPTGDIQWVYVGHGDCPCNTCTTSAIDPINAHSQEWIKRRTYKAPNKKMQLTATFCLFGSCSVHTTESGSNKIQNSTTTLSTDVASK